MHVLSSTNVNEENVMNCNCVANEPLAKPLEMLQASVAVTEKYGSGAYVPGKARGFAISSNFLNYYGRSQAKTALI
jgi:hypothetical protein